MYERGYSIHVVVTTIQFHSCPPGVKESSEIILIFHRNQNAVCKAVRDIIFYCATFVKPQHTHKHINHTMKNQKKKQVVLDRPCNSLF